jgi:glycosyltransferase involved in cell wall biosynthesis
VAKPLSVVFCWAEIAGYMPSCWRALAARPGVRLHVVHPRQLVDNPENPFDLEPLMAGLSHEMFDRSRPDLEAWLLETMRTRRPDAVVICGWVLWPYLALTRAGELADVRFVMGMDTPWRGTLRQRAARWRLAAPLRNVSAVITAGHRSAEYARRLGIAADRIHKGFYGFNDTPLAPVPAQRRASGAWPRRFLFVGRYVDAKGLDTMIEGYRRYRASVSDPWTLTCCGTGPGAPVLRGVEGVTDRGFTQPSEMPAVFRDHGAFVLASRYEPWGVVIAEAAASGLPVLCTSACGAADDIVRDFYNGLVFAPDDAGAVARAMRWIHDHEGDLASMGERGRAMAGAFSAESWAARWHEYLSDAAEVRG